jgi:FlaG/FlaF family flagellin (archaellin)
LLYQTIRKNSAVQPVIATIILIAGTLVLALAVGAYTFGLFGSNVKTVTLVSTTLYGGVTSSGAVITTGSLTISLNNPGSSTTVSSLTLTGSGLDGTISQWDFQPNSGTNSVNFGSSYIAGGRNAISPGSVSSFTYYPITGSSQLILTGQTFNYIINFANGQSVSGSSVAL